MLRISTCTIAMKTTSYSLGIWPFEIEDLEHWLSDLLPGQKFFVAVDHERWGDCFHPPPKGAFHKTATTTAVTAVTLVKLRKHLYRTRKAGGLVDLLCFAPRQKIHKKNRFFIESRLVQGKYGDVLKKWGGVVFYLHDGIHAIFYLPPSLSAVQSLFAKTLERVIPNRDTQDFKELWNCMRRTRPNKCIILAACGNDRLWATAPSTISTSEYLDGLLDVGNRFRKVRATTVASRRTIP